MSRAADRRIWIAAGVGTLAAAAAVQIRLNRLIAGDPAQALLADPPRGRTVGVSSPDGTRLHAEVFGSESPDAITFVLAHGWTENLTYWIHQIRALSAAGHRVVSFDLRGHGESGSAAGEDYAIERFGEDLEAVLDACAPHPGRTVVAGHSLGAMTIVAWAEHHEVRRRVAGAALFNTGVGELMAESLLIPVPALARLLNRPLASRRVLASRAPLPRFTTPLSHALTRYVAFGPAASPAHVAFYERMLIASPPDARADIGIALSELELHDALPRLDVPTTVVAGESDRLTPPSHAKKIAGRLPQLEQLIILPKTGHMAPLERPSEVTEALEAVAAAAVAKGGAVAV